MSRRVTVLGVPVWYTTHGSGDPLVLLHPGGVDSRALDPGIGGLTERFCVYAPDRRAHGRTPDVDGPLSYDDMASELVGFIEALALGPVHLVGMSDGAVVGLLAVLRRPDLVRRLAFVAGVFHRDGWHPSAIEASDEPPAMFRELYAEVSPDGGHHYPVVAAKLARMHREEPALSTTDLAAIDTPVLVMAGDDDEVRLEHAVAMYRALPRAELAIMPGTSHGLLVEKPELCGHVLRQFLTEDPVPTVAPIRRAPGTPC